MATLNVYIHSIVILPTASLTHLSSVSKLSTALSTFLKGIITKHLFAAGLFCYPMSLRFMFIMGHTQIFIFLFFLFFLFASYRAAHMQSTKQRQRHKDHELKAISVTARCSRLLCASFYKIPWSAIRTQTLLYRERKLFTNSGSKDMCETACHGTTGQRQMVDTVLTPRIVQD